MADPIASLWHHYEDGILLAWCVEHAPDGDADGAIARAWAQSTHDREMIWLLGETTMRDGVDWINEQTEQMIACGCDPDEACARCAARIRAQYAAPTFAQLCEARRG